MKYLTTKKQQILAILSVFLLSLAGCEKYSPEVKPEGDPLITSFKLTKADNSQLKEDVSGIINDADNSISIYIDYDLTDRMFKPTIEYTKGMNISPDPSKKIDGNSITEYTVSHKDKSKTYKVTFFINLPLSLHSLRVNDIKAYYNEKEGTYHAPVHQSKWNDPLVFKPVGTGIGNFYIDGTEVIPDQPTSMKLEFGKTYDIRVTKGAGEEVTAKLELIGLPIVSIKADFSLKNIPDKDEERGDCEISVYDPMKDGKFMVEDLFAGIKKRGGYSSSLYKKQPYSIEIRDRNTKEEIDTTLFDLRSDGDWILDAMATDISRMRNRLATDIWLDMHTPGYKSSEPKAKAATRGQMVELYFNDEYSGLYCVTEKIDRKQLKLDHTNGYLYKAKGWDKHVKFYNYDSRSLPRAGQETWAQSEEGYEAKYPEPFNWTPLVDFTKWFVDNTKSGTVSTSVAQEFEERFYIDNLVDYFIFINVIGATDNASKNTYLGIYNLNGSGNEKKFFYVPWDLDGVLGRNWDLSKYDSGYIIGTEDKDDNNPWGPPRQVNYLMKKLALSNNSSFKAKTQSRWAEVKNGVCSHESIMKRFRDYQTLLEGSGAYAKELDMWSSETAEPLGPEVNYVDTWLKEQLQAVDTYIQNWKIPN